MASTDATIHIDVSEEVSELVKSLDIKELVRQEVARQLADIRNLPLAELTNAISMRMAVQAAMQNGKRS